jgi:hypothetical protein
VTVVSDLDEVVLVTPELGGREDTLQTVAMRYELDRPPCRSRATAQGC